MPVSLSRRNIVFPNFFSNKNQSPAGQSITNVWIFDAVCLYSMCMCCSFYKIRVFCRLYIYAEPSWFFSKSTSVPLIEPEPSSLRSFGVNLWWSKLFFMLNETKPICYYFPEMDHTTFRLCHTPIYHEAVSYSIRCVELGGNCRSQICNV